jgi:NAD(P)H-nitrite reductase large subunit
MTSGSTGSAVRAESRGCPYLIIGNSAAATGGVSGIRELDRETPVTLIAREKEHTYSRPLIAYLLAGKVDESRMYYRPPDFHEKSGVRALLGLEVTRIDTQDHTVRTADGQTFAFEKLLIATGGKPVLPREIPGTDARGVFTFTTWEDARRIRSTIDEARVKRAVVVGGGLIGLKAVEALKTLGVETTVVELAERILSATFDQTASDLASAFLRKAGVEVRCRTTVSEIEVSKGSVTGVRLRDGSRLPVELLIFAIGVTPDAGLVKETDIAVDQGILTDDTMQTSVKGIYAAGDVVQTTDLLSGAKRSIPILPNAYRQGYVAGVNMAGKKLTFRGGISMNAVDICGLPTISVGVTDPGSDGYEILSTLDAQNSTYRKIVLKEDRIVGAIFVGQIDRAGIFTGLIKDRVNVSGLKDLLLGEEFGVLSLPKDYRKHVVSGQGIEV